jgi:hypothetical protein
MVSDNMDDLCHDALIYKMMVHKVEIWMPGMVGLNNMVA